MSPDPRWLEILKASGWQTTAITVACTIFLYLSHVGILPELPDWVSLLVSFATLVCGCLAITSGFSAAYKSFLPHFLHWRYIQDEKSKLRKDIPTLTSVEKEIISYLLEKNMKTFTADSDGGHAATLLSRGIIILAARPGQYIRLGDVPMSVPDHLWDVLIQHKDQFPYTPPQNGQVETQPWRRHWMDP